VSGPQRQTDLTGAVREFLTVLPPALAETVWAAAVPHTFDIPLLAAILNLDGPKVSQLCRKLQEMSFVQVLDPETYTLHELVRGFLLDQLWQDRRHDYRAWSRRAAEHLQARDGEPQRLESIYHWLIADPERGAGLVWNRGAEWNNTFQYEWVEALVRLGLEHDGAGRLTGRARGWVYFWQGQTHLRYSENRAALASLETALTSGEGDRPLEATCIQSLGDVHLRLAEYGPARERYAEALPIYREIGARVGEANCIQSLGDVHLRLAEYGPARERYAEALPIYREIGARLGEANCIQALGDVLMGEEQYEAAMASYQEAADRYRALELPSNEAGAVSAIAYLHQRLKQHDRALQAYGRAIQLAPENPMWYRNRAWEYIKVKNATAARADLDRAAQLQPHHPYLRLRRGDLAFLEEDYGTAITEYRAFLESLPRHNGAYYGLGLAYLALEDATRSRQAYTQALKLTTDHHDVEEALRDLQDWLDRCPGSVGADETLALLRHALEELR